MDIETGLETKAGVLHDAVVTHGEMMRAFEPKEGMTGGLRVTRT